MVKGWYGNSQKHSLASKGIKSKYVIVNNERLDIEEEVYRTLNAVDVSTIYDLLDSYTSDMEKIEFVKQHYLDGEYGVEISDCFNYITVTDPYDGDEEKMVIMEEWERITGNYVFDDIVSLIEGYMSYEEKVDWIENWHEDR